MSAFLRPKLSSARFVPAENVHLTVRFLGETTPEVVKGLLARLSENLDRSSAFELRVRGVGAFPSEKRARVLWAGIPEAPEPLLALARLVEARVVGAGFARESRPFRPHLTLARFGRPPKQLPKVIAPLKERDFGSLPVASLTCYRSHLSPGGASHEVIGRVALGRSGSLDEPHRQNGGESGVIRRS